MTCLYPPLPCSLLPLKQCALQKMFLKYSYCILSFLKSGITNHAKLHFIFISVKVGLERFGKRTSAGLSSWEYTSCKKLVIWIKFVKKICHIDFTTYHKTRIFR